MIRLHRITLAIVLLLSAGRPANAQQAASGSAVGAGGGEPASDPAEASVQSPLLDLPISRVEYALGPGDIVNLSAVGAINLLHELRVSPEGTLVVPEMGVLSVLGLNLEEAEAQARALILRFYRDVNVSLTLSRLRTFKVFVLGDIPDPGVRVATSATRVSELIPNLSDRTIRRNILLRRAGEDSVLVDLARFHQMGDLSSNPSLREGDAVIVRMVDQLVYVFGRVAFPGAYEFRAHESLAEFLRLINGGDDFPVNAADSIRLTRFVTPTEREFLSFSRTDALEGSGRSFILQPSDAVYIASVSNFREQKTATITGEVARPGTYPIRPDTTTVRDLVQMAGGLAADASLIRATLRRTQPRASSGTIAGLMALPPEALSPIDREVLRIHSQGSANNVVIDFVQLFAEGKEIYDQPLQTGDALTIPQRSDEVVVLGAVRNPGLIAHRPGQPVEYFITRVGGYARQADRRNVVVLKAKLGTRLDASDVRAIEPGDEIIVPFRERRTPLQIAQNVQSVITSVAGLVVTAIGLVNLVK